MDLKRYDLTHDELDVLLELLDLDGFKVLLKCMELEIKGLEEATLSSSVTGDVKTHMELVIKKAEIQGSRMLLKKVKEIKQGRRNARLVE